MGVGVGVEVGSAEALGVEVGRGVALGVAGAVGILVLDLTDAFEFTFTTNATTVCTPVVTTPFDFASFFGVGVGVGVAEGFGVGVGVGVGVAEGFGVGVGVGVAALPVTVIVTDVLTELYLVVLVGENVTERVWLPTGNTVPEAGVYE